MARKLITSPESRVAAAVVVAAGLLAFWPSAIGRIAAYRDTVCFTFPGRALLREAFREGRLPQWNPWVELGVPWLASPVHGVLYPGNLLLLVAPADVGFGLTWLLHAIWAGLGGFVLGRITGRRPWTSLVPALTFMLGGYAVSMWGNGDKVLSLSHVPWFAAALVHWGREPRRSRRMLPAAFALAAIATAGDPLVWIDAVPLGLVIATACDAGASDLVRRVFGHARRALTASALGAALAAPALVPAWLLRGETSRAEGFAREVAERWSLHPWRLLELVAPFAVGQPMNLDAYPGATLQPDPTVQALPYAISLYPGALVIAGVFGAARTKRTLVLAVGALLALVVAFGSHTPLHGALLTAVPPLGWMRYPEKHALVALALLSLLAADGLERVLDGQVHLARIGGGFVALAIVAALAAPSAFRPTTLHGLAYSLVAGACGVAALAAARRFAYLTPAAFVVLAAELVLHARPLLPWKSAQALHDSGRPMAAAVDRLAPGPMPKRVFRFERDPDSAPSIPDTLAALHHVGQVPGHDPAKSRRLAMLRGSLSMPRYLQALGLVGILLPPDVPSDLETSFVSSDGWRLHPIPHRPAAWLTGSVVALPPEAVAPAVMRGDVRLERDVVIEGGVDGAFDPATYAPCDVSDFAPERIVVECPPTGGGVLVSNDAYAPGWSATADGATARVVAVDVGLRGVVVPRGARTIVLAYACPGLVEGSLVALLAALVAALVFVRGRRAVD